MDTIIVEEITNLTPDVASAVRNLVAQLDENFEKLSDAELESILVSPDSHLFVAKDQEKIIGMITLVAYRIPYKKKAWLEDLVVDKAYRGQGIGSKLLDAAVIYAKKKGLKAVDLTSAPVREQANELYQKLGFEKRSTNVYRVKLQ